MQKVGMEMDVWATLAARVSCLAISHTSAYFIVGSLITFASPDGVENYCSRAKTIVLPLVKPSQQWRSRPLLDEGPSHFLFFFSPFLYTDKSSAFISQISCCSLQFALKLLSWFSLLWTLYCVTCISVYPHFYLTCLQPAPSAEERQRLYFFILLGQLAVVTFNLPHDAVVSRLVRMQSRVIAGADFILKSSDCAIICPLPRNASLRCALTTFVYYISPLFFPLFLTSMVEWWRANAKCGCSRAIFMMYNDCLFLQAVQCSEQTENYVTFV